MAQPITPRYMTDTVMAESIVVHYHPQWDELANAWVIDPTKVQVIGVGQLAFDGGTLLPAKVEVTGVDASPSMNAASSDLLEAIELILATKYAETPP